LQKQGHAHQRWRMRRLTRSGIAIHPLELFLKRFVEQLVSVKPEETEERPDALQTLHEHLVSFREFYGGVHRCIGVLLDGTRSRCGRFVDPISVSDRYRYEINMIGALAVSRW
jgi:hypothetical protein